MSSLPGRHSRTHAMSVDDRAIRAPAVGMPLASGSAISKTGFQPPFEQQPLCEIDHFAGRVTQRFGAHSDALGKENALELLAPTVGKGVYRFLHFSYFPWFHFIRINVFLHTCSGHLNFIAGFRAAKLLFNQRWEWALAAFFDFLDHISNFLIAKFRN